MHEKCLNTFLNLLNWGYCNCCPTAAAPAAAGNALGIDLGTLLILGMKQCCFLRFLISIC